MLKNIRVRLSTMSFRNTASLVRGFFSKTRIFVDFLNISVREGRRSCDGWGGMGGAAPVLRINEP